MATNAFKTIHHHSLRRQHLINHPPPPSTTITNTSKHPFFPKTATISLSTTPSAAITTSSATSQGTISYELLTSHLAAKNFIAADEETRRLLIVLAGEQAEKRGYVFFSETQFIPTEDLKTIDSLWRKHSEEKFGYSVQKKIWKKVNKDFTKFFIRVGWMKKLESSEVEQYNYRAFPGEFIWELEESTPEGHLPLTNALRGTQLLTSIFNHPAFLDEDEEEEETEGKDKSKGLLGTRTFKPNYSF